MFSRLCSKIDEIVDKTYDNILAYAYRNGYKKISHLMVQKWKNDWNQGLIDACIIGHKELALLMIENIRGSAGGTADWNLCLSYACKNGHMDLVKLMIEKGANEWNHGLENACLGGHMEIILLMIEKGATGWNMGLYYACWEAHKDIVELMIEKGANNWNLGLEGACNGGHIEFAKLMFRYGANNLTKGLRQVLQKDKIELVLFLIENGAYIDAYYYTLPDPAIYYLTQKGMNLYSSKQFREYQTIAHSFNESQTNLLIILTHILNNDLTSLILEF